MRLQHLPQAIAVSINSIAYEKAIFRFDILKGSLMSEKYEPIKIRS